MRAVGSATAFAGALAAAAILVDAGPAEARDHSMLVVQPPAAVGAPMRREVEGFELGADRTEVMRQLVADRWKIRQRPKVRRGISYLGVIATKRRGELRRIKLRFYEDRLLYVRIYYRSRSAARVSRVSATCATRLPIGRRLDAGCIDESWKTAISVRRRGRRVTLADLGTLLAAGFVTRADVEKQRRFGQARRP